MTEQTTSSWLGAGVYVPPKNAPQPVTPVTPSSEPTQRTDSEVEQEIAKEVESPQKQPLDKSKQSDSTKSPTTPMEEQMQSQKTSSGWTRGLFGCQDDTTVGEEATTTTRHAGLMETIMNSLCACDGDGRSQFMHPSSIVKDADEMLWVTPSGRVGSRPVKPMQPFGPEHLPVQDLTVNDKPFEVSRGISELTMRSCHRPQQPDSEERRMAYYAVGKNHSGGQSGQKGNRRCYFTGKYVTEGNPFYAGSVQQGMRTLVVFLLPSALDLPTTPDRPTNPDPPKKKPSAMKSSMSFLSKKGKGNKNKGDTVSTACDEELDSNYGMDKNYLLKALPEFSDELLQDLQSKYPEQYETLPQQVRLPSSWRLYTRFCYFSGLPIAEGEAYYKVRDEIEIECEDDIVLSHEVMEAVNGASAEILRLPNIKTFDYLKCHYAQQAEKLPESVFERISWELVLPEV
eukprot:scaffold6241_cov129-Cylindrotheca_fusiformis.AAC.7